MISANSRDQINSRLDFMGNITPVIRTTSEVSNAVPVINGPIKRPEERTDRKMFTYIEPIPIAEAVVLNCRIEEKLYPQSTNSHDYFVRNYLKDRNSRLNSNSCSNKPVSQENYVAAAASSQTELSFSRTGSRKDLTVDLYEKEIMRHEEQNQDNNPENSRKEEGRIQQEGRDSNEEDLSLTMLQKSNCVSTIKKCSIQHSKEHSNEMSTNNCDSEAMNNLTLPKTHQDNCKKQNDVHWRRKIAETLKPC